VIFVWIVSVVIAVCVALWCIVGNFDLDKRLKAVERSLDDHSAPRAPELPLVVPDPPTFVSGPSCAICFKPVTESEAIKVDAEIPISVMGPPMPVTLYLHQEHSDVVSPGGDYSIG
jgi:hypothetical protein